MTDRELNKRTCQANPWAGSLIRWLNVDQDLGVSRRVLLSRQRILDLTNLFGWTLAVVGSAPRNANLIDFPPSELTSLLSELERRLSRYSTVPFAFIEVDGSLAVDDVLSGRGLPGESVAAHAVIELAKKSLLHRVRQCICGKHFYANFLHQKSCSPACRHKQYEQTDGFKKRRRIYMRNYYRLKRSGKVK